MPSSFRIEDPEADFVRLQAAGSSEDGSAKQRQFAMKAYNGGRLNVGFGYPVVVDLSGLKVTAKARPILRQHDPDRIVGHTTRVGINAGSIDVAGVVSGANEHASEVVNSSDGGFPWQASIGASVKRMVFVDKGETVEANGRRFSGPVYVARQSVLGEVSFVPLGADDTTSARMVAGAADSQSEVIGMAFEKWLEANGLVLADLNDDTVQALRSLFHAAGDDASDDPTGVAASAGGDGASVDGLIEQVNAAATAAVIRISGIQAACASHPEIAARALKDGWDVERTKTEVELATLRASRPTAPNLNLGAGGPDRMNVLSAAIQSAAGIDQQIIISDTSEAALEAARREFRAGIGLQEMLLEAAIAGGYDSRSIGSVRNDLERVLRAAFSTTSLPGILGATANKSVARGFDAVESTWRAIAAIRPVNDFKTVTSYTLTGDMTYDQVGPDGQLKHGAVGEESYTNKADTYGKLFAITRPNIINDDLGVLTDVPRKIGRGAAVKFNKVFWTEFLDNATFFTAGNPRNNYDEGVDTVLDIDGLTAAELLFLDQTDPDGEPLGADPTILLVPNGQFVTATNLMASTEVNNGGTTDTPTRNPHAGKFQVVKSSYLGNATYAGFSALAWYLLADPQDVPVIEAAFLNGKETPTVESTDANFDTLGVVFRGFHDFGVNKQEYRGGVKFKGEA